MKRRTPAELHVGRQNCGRVWLLVHIIGAASLFCVVVVFATCSCPQTKQRLPFIPCRWNVSLFFAPQAEHSGSSIS